MDELGGMAALGPLVIGYIKDSFLSQLITFFFGFLIFMDDYGNTLIVGNTIRPITDTMRLSREKLSFLVDCTSAPIASIVPVSICVEINRGASPATAWRHSRLMVPCLP